MRRSFNFQLRTLLLLIITPSEILISSRVESRRVNPRNVKYSYAITSKFGKSNLGDAINKIGVLASTDPKYFNKPLTDWQDISTQQDAKCTR